MPIYAKAGPSFTPAPAGAFPAVCLDVVDLGLLEVAFGGKQKKQHKIKIVWQLAAEKDGGGHHRVSKRYTLSLHEKSSLRKDLESWRGRAFSAEELAGFDVETVLNKPVLLNVIHNVKDGTTYANVSTLMRLPQGMTAPTPDAGYIRECDRSPDDQGADDPGNYGDMGLDEVPF